MATELIRHHAVKPRPGKPQNNCARCGDSVRHGDDHLRVHTQGATIVFHWACFFAQMFESGQRNTKSAAAIPSVLSIAARKS
jgi:hypothetical protein